MTPITVLIADDHAPTLADLRSILEEDGRFLVCDAVPDAAAAVTAAEVHRPDLCLLDIRMPGNGISACWEIAARLPTSRIVMLTVSSDDRDLFAALRAGAVGYLLKDIDPSLVANALADVWAGEAVLPGNLVARVVAEFRDRGPRRRTALADGPGGTLTSREWQVLDLMRLDLSTSEIARRLFISQTTVRDHVASILRKLRVPDRESAVELFDAR